MPGSPSSIAAKFFTVHNRLRLVFEMILQITLLSWAVAQNFSPPLLASKVKVSEATESGASRK